MRQRLLSLTLVLVTFVSSAQAQAGNWQDVKDLYPGPIFVEVGHRVPIRCIFQHATDTTLFCERTYRTPFSEPDQIMFDRMEIHRITYQYYRGGNALKGGLIGAGIGAAAGAAGKDAGNRIGNAVLGGALGALFGSFIGGNWQTLHTQVVYQK
jgi:hypothetical protein